MCGWKFSFWSMRMLKNFAVFLLAIFDWSIWGFTEPGGLYLPFRFTSSHFVGKGASSSCWRFAESVETVASVMEIVEFRVSAAAYTAMSFTYYRTKTKGGMFAMFAIQMEKSIGLRSAPCGTLLCWSWVRCISPVGSAMWKLAFLFEIIFW